MPRLHQRHFRTLKLQKYSLVKKRSYSSALRSFSLITSFTFPKNRLKYLLMSNQFSHVLNNSRKSAKRFLLSKLVLRHASGSVRQSTPHPGYQYFQRVIYDWLTKNKLTLTPPAPKIREWFIHTGMVSMTSITQYGLAVIGSYHSIYE